MRRNEKKSSEKWGRTKRRRQGLRSQQQGDACFPSGPEVHLGKKSGEQVSNLSRRVRWQGGGIATTGKGKAMRAGVACSCLKKKIVRVHGRWIG